MTKLRLFLAVLLSSLFVLPGANAGAQTRGTVSVTGLSISPAIEQFEIKPGQAELTYKIRLDNNLNQPVKIKVSSLDFRSLNDTGGLAFIGSNADEVNHRYGLAKWLVLPKEVDVAAGGGQFIKVSIDNRADLSTGGHYAAILFSLESAAAAKSTSHVEVNQVVSSLLFVSKQGSGLSESVDLDKVKFNAGLFSWPTKAKLYFKNTGNVQTAPHGLFSLRGPNQLINENSYLVLPASTRLYTLDLKTKKPFWPWHYQAHISYRAGSGQLSFRRVNVLYINPWFALAAALILIFIAASNRRLRRFIWRSIKRVLRFARRLLRVARLFVTVYIPYRYRRYQKAKKAKRTKKQQSP